MRKHISTIIAGIIFLTGLSLLLYPTISNYWNSRHQTQAVAEYSDRMEKMDEKEKEQLIEEAEAYNYKMSRPNVQKILYKNVQLVCLF